MKTNSDIKIFVLVLFLLVSACKRKGNPLDQMQFRMPFAKDDTTVELPTVAGPEQKDNSNITLPNVPRGGEVLDDEGNITLPNRPQPPIDNSLLPQPQQKQQPQDQGPPVIPMPIFAPPPPQDDFGDIPPFPGIVMCNNNVVTQYIDEDGIIVGEQCEDGNGQNGDGCSSVCLKEYCGNGIVDPGEQCDPGSPTTLPLTKPPLWNHAIPTLDCDEFCELIICGDGIINGHEQCDDCNRLDCDGCSSDCKLERLGEPPCSFTCTPTSPYTCDLTPGTEPCRCLLGSGCPSARIPAIQPLNPLTDKTAK